MAKKNTPSTPASADARETAVGYLHSMLMQRRFEEKSAEAYAIGKIGGFCHLYIGQEAVSTGTMAALSGA